MALRSEHFITPIKLVLPGIIVSVIGLFASNYIFNNPEKNRAKATYSTWKVVTQFEDLFEKNADLIPCRSDSFNQVQMKKDLLHLIEMTRQNILDLKAADNIDKRLAAIINLKIDSYNERRKNTETYLDSMDSLYYESIRENYDTEKELELTSWIQVKFHDENAHITNRDTAVINSILNDLTKNYNSYVDSFKVENKKQTAQEIQSYSIGKWLTTDNVLINVNKDGTGHWKHVLMDTSFTWTFDTSMISKDTLNPRLTNLKIKFPNGNFFPMEILKANNDVLLLMFHDQKKNRMYGSACRQ